MQSEDIPDITDQTRLALRSAVEKHRAGGYATAVFCFVLHDMNGIRFVASSQSIADSQPGIHVTQTGMLIPGLNGGKPRLFRLVVWQVPLEISDMLAQVRLAIPAGEIETTLGEAEKKGLAVRVPQGLEGWLEKRLRDEIEGMFGEGE